MAEKKFVQTVAVDFDKVIHKYSQGWKDGEAYDWSVFGTEDGLKRLMAEYAVFIFTSRGPIQVSKWFEKRLPMFKTIIDTPYLSRDFWNEQGTLLITQRKYPAAAYIDDRAIQFHNWPQALSDLKKLLEKGSSNYTPSEEERELHADMRHPAYVYETTTGRRKAWDTADVPPDHNYTWELNEDFCKDAWVEFEHTEQRYWRRRKTPSEILDMHKTLLKQVKESGSTIETIVNGITERVTASIRPSPNLQELEKLGYTRRHETDTQDDPALD